MLPAATGGVAATGGSGAAAVVVVLETSPDAESSESDSNSMDSIITRRCLAFLVFLVKALGGFE